MLGRVFGRFTLSFVVTTVLVLLLTVMAGMTWLLTFRNGQASIRELADHFGRLSMQDIRRQLEGYLSVPPLINDINSYPFEADQEEPLSAAALAHRFAAELIRFGSVVSIAYANEQGEYVGMARGAEDVPFSLGVSDASTGGHLAGFRSDSEGHRGAEFDRSEGPFDSRVRPWYSAAIEAKGPVWTPVYLWLTGDAGIDLVMPVRDFHGAFRGVLDTSLTLEGMGKFLQGVRPTPHSQAFIMERSGLLVAASDVATPYRHVEGALQRFSALDSTDPVIRAAARRIMAAVADGESLDIEKQYEVTLRGSRQVVRAGRFGDRQGLDWFFAEVIPESEFAQPIYDDVRSTAVFVALFLLAAAAAGLLLARRIAAPLRLLTATARSMGSGDLAVQIPVTGTWEVSQLSASFNSMAAQLRQSFGSLAESESRYRTFVAASSAGIFRFEAREPMPMSLSEDEQVQWFYRSFFLAECNEMAAGMFGADGAEHILGQGPEIWLPRTDPSSLAYLRRMMRLPSSVSSEELIRLDRRGVMRTLLTSVTTVVEARSVQRLWGVFRDVTEQRANEEALRRSEARLRSIFHRSAVSFLEADFSALHAAVEDLAAGGVTDVEAFLRENPEFVKKALRCIRIVDANETAVELLGARSREELLGPLNVHFHPDAYSRVLPSAIANAQAGRQHDLETSLTTGSGVTLDVIIHFYVPDEHDALANMLISVVDITKRTQAERERLALQEELRQAQKVETMGRLAGGISHDINNLLTPILAGGELLLMDEPGVDRRDTAGQVLSAANRIRELTRKLLAFSRKQDLQREVVRLDDVAADFQMLMRRMLRANVDLRFLRGEPTDAVQVDVGQVEQVLMNLVLNAQDAMPAGGTVTIEVRNTEEAGERAQARGVQPGRYVALTVTDTGNGMDAAAQEHLFEPFFTTKDRGKGTGLGLSTVYGIVRQHGGHILVDSDPGWGTRFRILIPRHEPA
jgi:signal transduction histidine kinase